MTAYSFTIDDYGANLIHRAKVQKHAAVRLLLQVKFALIQPFLALTKRTLDARKPAFGRKGYADLSDRLNSLF